MKNWKTTLAGVLGGSFGIIPAVIEWLNGGTLDLARVAGGVVLLMLGLFAKDNNVTGGTVGQ